MLPALTGGQTLSAAWGCAAGCNVQSPQPSQLLPQHRSARCLIHPTDRQRSSARRWHGAGAARLLWWDPCPAQRWTLAQEPASAGICGMVPNRPVKIFSSPWYRNQQHCYQTPPGRDICYLNGLYQMKGIEARKSSTSLFPKIISTFKQFICLLTGRF